MQDKVALITGGGTGIGRAIAEAHLRQGARVAVTGRRAAPLQALADEHGDAVLALEGDVTRAEDRERWLGTVIEQFGRLDVLVNNAGVFESGPLVETSDEQIARMFQVNVVGLLSLTRDAVPHLSKSKGSVVNISSTASSGVLPMAAAYSATKAAVDHATRTLAAELGPAGVRVNAVAPGMTVTDMTAGMRESDEMVQAVVAQTPLGRLGEPAEIADAVTFLSSQDARWVTGQVLQASGGLLL